MLALTGNYLHLKRGGNSGCGGGKPVVQLQPGVQQGTGPKGSSGVRSYNDGVSKSDPGAAGDTRKSKTCPAGEAGEASAAAWMVKIDTAPSKAEAPKYDGEASEKGHYVTVWVPDHEETEQQAQWTDA